jgi:hypothetical protein
MTCNRTISTALADLALDMPPITIVIREFGLKACIIVGVILYRLTMLDPATQCLFPVIEQLHDLSPEQQISDLGASHKTPSWDLSFPQFWVKLKFSAVDLFRQLKKA